MTNDQRSSSAQVHSETCDVLLSQVQRLMEGATRREDIDDVMKASNLLVLVSQTLRGIAARPGVPS